MMHENKEVDERYGDATVSFGSVDLTVDLKMMGVTRVCRCGHVSNTLCRNDTKETS